MSWFVFAGPKDTQGMRGVSSSRGRPPRGRGRGSNRQRKLSQGSTDPQRKVMYLYGQLFVMLNVSLYQHLSQILKSLKYSSLSNTQVSLTQVSLTQVSHAQVFQILKSLRLESFNLRFLSSDYNSFYYATANGMTCVFVGVLDSAQTYSMCFYAVFLWTYPMCFHAVISMIWYFSSLGGAVWVTTQSHNLVSCYNRSTQVAKFYPKFPSFHR